MRHTTLRPLVLMTGIVLTGHLAAALDSEPRRFDVSQLFQEVESIVLRHYPGASGSTNQHNEIVFEYETQMFMVHFPLKTGEWQEPTRVKGPKRRGIVVNVSVRDGAPRPRAAIGNKFDHCYYIDFFDGHHSETIGAHVNLTVKYPRVYPEEFVQELRALLPNFDQYVVVLP